MLSVKNINFKFDNKIIYKNFSLKFEDNKINCIIGPSSCGKTTLLRMIAGLQGGYSGQITNTHKGLAFVFQEDTLIEEISVFKNIEIVIKKFIKSKTKIKKIINEYLKIANMLDAKDLFPNQLSGSARQRVALIRAFVYPSDLILMDEPFISLDYNLKSKLIKLFLKLYKKTKRTILVVTHNIDDSVMFANKIFIFSQKPVTVIDQIEIKPAFNERLINKKMFDYRNQIIKDALKW